MTQNAIMHSHSHINQKHVHHSGQLKITQFFIKIILIDFLIFQYINVEINNNLIHM